VRIEWSDVAFEDLAGIQDYIAKDVPFYADQFIEKLMSATRNLTIFPEMGRQVPEADEDDGDIRELIFHSYRIMYRINQQKGFVLIVTVVHSSRDIAGQEPKPWVII
jgi:plasmid stabilization system protein ParE